jgi:hypothetical protein
MPSYILFELHWKKLNEKNHCVQLNLMTFNVLQEIGESTSEEDQAKLDKTKVL